MDDLISRQAAIDAINHICPLDTEYDCALLDRVDVRCVLSDLPSVESEITEAQVKEYCEKRLLVVLTFDAFQRLKSTQPERKKGKWLYNKGPYELFKCSSCGEYWLDWYVSGRDSDWMSKKLKFCPNCGADMRGYGNDN